jgi:hypothetical protein
MSNDNSTYEPERGANPDNTGQFSETTKSTPSFTVVAGFKRDNVVGEAPEWRNGGMATGVEVIESPVSDRDRNYHLTFDVLGGYVFVNPAEFGIEDPESDCDDWQQLDRLYISREIGGADGVLETQFESAVRDTEFTELLSDVSEEQMAAIEAEVRQELRAQLSDGVDVDFSSNGERWDDVRVLYSKTFDAEQSPATVDNDGRTSVTTSNLMPSLEEDATYVRVRAGAGDTIIRQVLARHDIDVD